MKNIPCSSGREELTPEQKKMNLKRKEVMDLRDKDNYYQDSIQEIAIKEGECREKLKTEGISDKAVIERLADYFSDESLEKQKAKREKWEDSLTGLRNRNAYMAESLQFLEIAKRQGKDIAFLMIDFDHFKKVNDVHGHIAGDDALKKIASIIQDEARASDGLYRYGGEEFMMCLPDTNSQEALILAERVRSAVEDALIQVKSASGLAALKKTVSIGCFGTDQLDDWHDRDTSEVLEEINSCSDKALYHSKENGRNQVTIFEDETGKKEG